MSETTLPENIYQADHHFCESRFRANDQEIAWLKKTNLALLEALRLIFSTDDEGHWIVPTIEDVNQVKSIMAQIEQTMKARMFTEKP